MPYNPIGWLLGLGLAVGPGATLRAQGLVPRHRQVVAPPADKARFRVYLLVGQSNMAGRGAVAAADTLPSRRVLRLNAGGQWELAQDPLHFDKPTAGVGPGLTFGRWLAAADTSLVIGLVPSAVGGSGIDAWAPGAYFADTRTHPYDDALARARAAQRAGTLAGIIWHQGETDSSPDKSRAYAPKLAALVARFRADLQAPDLPFVAGRLPAFQFEKVGPDGRPQPNPGARRVNAAVASLRRTVPHYAVVSAAGTTDRGDHLHFDARSTRLLGRRYAQAMRRLQRRARSLRALRRARQASRKRAVSS